MSKLKTFVVGTNSQVTNMFFMRPGFETTNEIRKADIVCFTGGADVTPSLYGQRQIPNTTCVVQRDIAEEKCYKGLSKQQLKVGICRGGQFLNVMNGGSMWQDVDGHATGAFITHPIILQGEDKFRNVNSTHHQMMIPNFEDPNMEVLGLAARSTYRTDDVSTVRKMSSIEEDPDYEIIWYEDSMSFCFQPHPEYGHKETHQIFFDLLKEKGYA